MAGSRAASAREPGQVREEAALSGPAHAPRTSLAGAEDRRARPKTGLDGGCTVHLLRMGDEQRNLEVVRKLGERWNAGDFDGVLALYHDDVEMVTDPTWPEPPTRGKEAFARSSEDWRASWEKIDIDVAGVEARGDTVIAEGAWDTRGAASGIGGTMPFGILFTIRDGLVVRLRWFRDSSEARGAAELT